MILAFMIVSARQLAPVFVASLLIGAPAGAADIPPPVTTDQPHLATWLDADVGLCLQINNLTDQGSRFIESPLHERMVRFPPIAVWLAQHRQNLAALRDEIERRTGLTCRDVATKLLGRQILFAIWPPFDPAVDKPAALLLVESADEELMRRSLETLVAARRQAGRWRGQHTLQVADHTFSVDVVVPDDEGSEFFLTSVDRVAVIATSESLVRDVLERRAAIEKRTSSLAASLGYAAAVDQLSADNAVRLFINPRAWDAALEADLKRKEPGSEEAKSQAGVVAAWRATQYVAAGARLAPQLGVELAWTWRADELPEPVREAAASLSGRSQFLDSVPADSLVAFAGRLDITRLARYAIARQWREAASPPDNSQASNDLNGQRESIFAWTLAAGLGPDYGGYLASSSRPRTTSSDTSTLPVDLVVGLQTKPLETGGDQPAVAEFVDPLLHALLSATVEAVNRQAGPGGASLRTIEANGRKVTSVSGIVPGRPLQELAYCVDRHDRIWLGTSAAALEQAISSASGNSLVEQPRIRRMIELAGNEPGGLFYVNLAGWRKLAAKGPEALDFLWHDKHLDARGKEQQYQAVVAIAQLADRLLLATHVDEATVHLSLAIAADAP